MPRPTALVALSRGTALDPSRSVRDIRGRSRESCIVDAMAAQRSARRVYPSSAIPALLGIQSRSLIDRAERIESRTGGRIAWRRDEHPLDTTVFDADWVDQLIAADRLMPAADDQALWLSAVPVGEDDIVYSVGALGESSAAATADVDPLSIRNDDAVEWLRVEAAEERFARIQSQLAAEERLHVAARSERDQALEQLAAARTALADTHRAHAAYLDTLA